MTALVEVCLISQIIATQELFVDCAEAIESRSIYPRGVVAAK